MPEAQCIERDDASIFGFDLCQCRDDEINKQDRGVVTAAVVPGGEEAHRRSKEVARRRDHNTRGPHDDDIGRDA